MVSSQTPIRDAITIQMDVWWDWFQWRTRGLTDDEYFWEPAEGCWSVRPAADGRYRYEFEWPPLDPPPITTIAWRLVHMVTTPLDRTDRYFANAIPFDTDDCPSTAHDALALLSAHWNAWREGLGGVADEELLTRPLDGGGHENFRDMRLLPTDPLVNMVLHVHRELIHHGAEVALLRDLYRDNVARRR